MACSWRCQQGTRRGGHTPQQVCPSPAFLVSPPCTWGVRRSCHPSPSDSPGGGRSRGSWGDSGTVAAPGKCHEEQEAPEAGRPLSRPPPPHCVRMFLRPHVVPRGTGLCLNPRSPRAPRRRAETGGARSRGGTADIGGMWVLRWSLATLQGTAVAAHPAASASCCLLLHPALPLQRLWGLLTEGTCCSTRCSRAFGDVGSLLRLCPSPNHPLPERKPSQQPSSSRAPRDAQQGRPSPHVHNSISLSRLDRQTDRNSLPPVSTFSQAPAPASSSWPPSVGFYT